MKEFNEGIKKIIEKFAYEFFVVQQDFKIKCTCVNFTTKQAEPACEKCLGLGNKIKIKKIKGASEDRKGTFRNAAVMEANIAFTYFIDAKYPIFENNIIIDGEEVLKVYRVEKKKTPEAVYTQCYAVHKKTNPKLLMKNFNKIIGRVEI